ncbi:hypothetical protein EOD41_15480 [Mucilaginibacter limnophilus]|uniref:ATPase n=1 Tax=Mucilaginibacter limnophilus TaxID=1932778 RepID=A0A437MQC4_9SPHI|nr:hypothetical protein [Mucilaginibacter limnophilus]RVT99840.1 hypothetical protein EOD41_15480 [Mucilaginibacter limnophilus]
MLFTLNAFQYNSGCDDQILLSVTINKPVQVIYPSLTDAFRLKQLDLIKKDNRHIVITKAGTTVSFIVADEVPNRYVEWRHLADESNEQYIVCFELEPKNSDTILTFKLKCWSSSQPVIDWEALLLKLKTVCEDDSQRYHYLKLASLF